ncbi:hypothetical protein ACVWYG_003924 [Pedobacter sp. UYEF25]
MITEILTPNVVDLLKKELPYSCTLQSYLGQVVLEIGNIDFEQQMGSLVQKIQSAIDLHFPDRDEDLCVVIKNRDTGTQNTIKIWKPYVA